MKVTVAGENGSQRISLPDEPVWEGIEETGTGVSLRAVYFGTRSRRIVCERHSAWDRGDGRSRGTYYTLHEPGDADYPDLLGLLDDLDVEIPDALETAEAL